MLYELHAQCPQGSRFGLSSWPEPSRALTPTSQVTSLPDLPIVQPARLSADGGPFVSSASGTISLSSCQIHHFCSLLSKCKNLQPPLLAFFSFCHARFPVVNPLTRMTAGTAHNLSDMLRSTDPSAQVRQEPCVPRVKIMRTRTRRWAERPGTRPKVRLLSSIPPGPAEELSA